MNLRVNSTHAYAERGLDAYSTPSATSSSAGSHASHECGGYEEAKKPEPDASLEEDRKFLEQGGRARFDFSRFKGR